MNGVPGQEASKELDGWADRGPLTWVGMAHADRQEAGGLLLTRKPQTRRTLLSQPRLKKPISSRLLLFPESLIFRRHLAADSLYTGNICSSLVNRQNGQLFERN